MPRIRKSASQVGPPGSAGVPPAQVLAQPRRSPPPGSTGNGARTLLRPSPCRSRRQGGRLLHRRETERHATAVHAGGTPALPGGPSSHRSCCSRGARRLAGPRPCRCGRAVTLGGPSSSFGALRGSLSTIRKGASAGDGPRLPVAARPPLRPRQACVVSGWVALLSLAARVAWHCPGR